MFTLEQIQQAHSKVKSGADFPKYIQDIKQLEVISFETWTIDSHTDYFGKDDFEIASQPKYAALSISQYCDKEKFSAYLKIHQQGQTDYFTFCQHCAETGIEKWIVSLEKMTCIYYDKAGNEILVETVPSL